MFSFFVCNASHKNKNWWKKLKYNIMTCEKMEHQIEMMYFNLLLQKKIIDIHVEIEKK
jgi:hypothetical protein